MIFMLTAYRKYLLLLIVCISVHHTLFCQPIENQFTHYTTKDGLSDGYITDIKQDSAGFLWLATLNGLCRFDGHSFKTFRNKPNDTTSLCENHLNNIYIDSQNHLWCVSYNCLYLYHPDGEWFEHFYMDGYNLEEVAGEENNQLILACSVKGLFKFDKKSRKISSFDHEEFGCGRCYNYLQDRHGEEWMTIKQGLVRFDQKTKQYRPVYHTGGRLLELPNGNILCGTYGEGLLLIDRVTNGVKQFLPVKNNVCSLLGDIVYCLYQLNDSIVLVGNDGGISVFNWKTQTFRRIVHEETNPLSLSGGNTAVRSFFLDREGILWIGKQQLERYDFSNFTIKTYPANGREHVTKPFNGLLCFFPCPDGRFLLGADRGMSIYDPKTGKLCKVEANEFRQGTKETFKLVDCFQADMYGNTWCFSSPNFYSFRIKNKEAIDIHEHHFPFSIHLGGMMLDKKGCMYAGTWGKGLIKFDSACSSYKVFDTSDGSPARLTNMKIRALCAASDGSVWVGTQKGINKIEKDGKTVKQYSQHRDHYGSITDWILSDIKEDSHGIIWFSTLSHGIGRIDPTNDSVTFLSVEQGLPTCQFFTICMDAYGYLWAKSKMGILRINTATFQSQLYAENEGFPDPDNIIDMKYSSYNKKLYILTAYAIYEIDPQIISTKSRIPETVITGFRVSEKEKKLPATGIVTLDYKDNFINIEFAALLFHSNELIKYAYKMEGVDKDWVYCNYKRNAAYTGLPPGHYTFNVKAQSPGGVWNNIPTQLSIVIRPPLWQTWWFYLLEAVAGITVSFWAIRFYTNIKLAKQRGELEKLQAVSNERSRIASEMHDELGSGLTSIRMLSEIAGGKINHDLIPKSEIEKIERSASNLSENLREIIWTMNTKFDKLDDFIIYVRTYAVEYFEDSPIKFQFNRPQIIPEITLNGELRRNLFLCIKEAMNNILKHSQATEASLTFVITGNSLVIEIRDNGIGINLAQTGKLGNGLNTMKDRLKKFGSDLEIEVNGGTKLVFKIDI